MSEGRCTLHNPHARSLRWSKRLEREEVTFTMCGSPAYTAPEILTEQGYSSPSDWSVLTPCKSFRCGSTTSRAL